jgi:protein TonB
MGVYTHSDGNWLSRRGTFLVILIAFHMVLFWALKSGFAVKFVKAITAPIKAEIIQNKPEEPPPPPPPQVRIEQPPVQVPPVLVDIPLPVDPPPTVIIAETTTKPTPPAPPTPAPPKPAVVVPPGYRFKPDTADYYPNQSRNLGEEGVVKIRACYDLKGNVSEATVSESSNVQRLDDAGIRYGKALKLKPGSVDGKVSAGCVVVPVRFSLKGEQ